MGLVVKGDSTYTLTDEGRKASQLLEAIKSESRGIFDKSPKRRIKGGNVVLRGATYADLQGLIKLWRTAYQDDDEPDYHVAMRFTDAEGLRAKILRSPKSYSGKGRIVFVAEHEGEIIACCIVGLMSLAHMKAEYVGIVREDELPAELRLPISEKEKQFYDRYWEAENRLIETHTKRTAYIEIEYGVTGTWSFPFEPIQLIFTQKRLDTGGYVTADLEGIFDEILKCRKIMVQAIDTRRQTQEAIDGSNPAHCYEIYTLVHPDYNREEVAGMVLRYIEDEASKQKIGYIVTGENPDEIEARKFWKDNGFAEIHQHEFRYKPQISSAGRIERYLFVKKI